MSNYEQLTNRLLDLCAEGRQIVDSCDALNQRMHAAMINNDERARHITGAESTAIMWSRNCEELLRDTGLEIELVKFRQTYASPIVSDGYNYKLSAIRGTVSAQIDFLVDVAQRIENQQSDKELVSITLEDLDGFSGVREVFPADVNDYAKSAFLEDDVEEAFLAAIGEPYKELDSGVETRDLFTDRLIYKGRRLHSAIMFKGRGVKGPLTLRNCGDRGNQLLKLAKNNAAECFIVQHVNKIEPDVKETLIDLVLMNSRYSTIYVGFIDGVDTARFLRSRGMDLEALSKKRAAR